MGTQPSRLRHLLQHNHHQKYKNSPKLNLKKKNKLIVLKRAVAGAANTANNKWRNINNNGSIIELLSEIEQNEHLQNEENIEMEERINKEKKEEIYSNDLNEINEFKEKYQQKYFFKNQRTTTLAELAKMQKEMDIVLNTLKSKLEKLEEEQRRKINICATKWGIEMLKNSVNLQKLKTLKSDKENKINNKKQRKLQTIAEECRLRSAILTDKFKNCTEYLRGFEALINTIQREKECNAGDDDFLREFLIKTAKKQYNKGQLGQAVDTFCQLLIATDGRLCDQEMLLLVDVFKEKIKQTRKFHERINGVIKQQMNDSPYVMDELWGFVLEELRVDCAEAFEIVMIARGVNNCEEKGEEVRKVEKLKYLLGSIICALWLQITPYRHEEFEQIKQLFLNTLDHYNIISTKTAIITNEQKLLLINKNELELEKSVQAVLEQYPMLANTKKMRRFTQQMFSIIG